LSPNAASKDSVSFTPQSSKTFTFFPKTRKRLASQPEIRKQLGVPDHLPQKLSISSWIWSWIVAATPGEPYDDLERCVLELKQRGFNTVRIETGLNWAFKLDGQPRGLMTFGPWIAGHGWNLSSMNGRGGGTLDVLERLFRLFELAKQHGIFVILTSWEYQDSTSFVADPRIRAEVYAIPEVDRLRNLAMQHDRLLTLLKKRELEKQVAFVEVHNEPEYSEFSKGPELKGLHQEAVAFLRERHPDILIGGDFASHDYALIPHNVQVFDQHIYAGAAWYFGELYGETVLQKDFHSADPHANEILRRVLKKDLVSWDEFMKPAANIRPFWRPVMWMFENLDNEKWDAWVAERFVEWKDRIWAEARKRFAEDAQEGHRRNLPLILDEGGFFYPPRLSRFEVSPDGLSLLDLFTDLAIEHNYWGTMPGTYSGPEHLLWQQPEWLRRNNERFLTGKSKG